MDQDVPVSRGSGRKKVVFGVVAACVVALSLVVALGGPKIASTYKQVLNYNFGPDLVAVTVGNVTGIWEGPHGSSISVEPNGSLSAIEMPTGLFDDFAQTPGRFTVSGTGSWSIVPAESNGTPAALDASVGQHLLELQMTKTHSNLALLGYIGDPDNDDAVLFVKDSTVIIHLTPVIRVPGGLFSR